MKSMIAASLLSLASIATADEILLKTGGRLSGIVVAQSQSSVTIEMGPGRVTVPMSRVERIVTSTASLSVYRDRAARLAADDLQGWLALAVWAQERALSTQAREAFEHVVQIDPRNDAANRALGNVSVEGRWLSPDEGNRARGLVLFEGRWMTPAERDAEVQERRTRSDQTLAEKARSEADARVREAEAAAREAEARARGAEAEQQTGAQPLAPLGWGAGAVVNPCIAPDCAPQPRVTCGPHMSGPACPPSQPPAASPTPMTRATPLPSVTPPPSGSSSGAHASHGPPNAPAEGKGTGKDQEAHH